MRNISKILKSLLVGALIVNTPVNEAKAFFLMPPMPWDVELDVPANANKIVANSQTLYRQYQTYASELNTGKLQAIKKAAGLQFGNLKNKTLSSEGKGKAKTPLKKEVKNNNELGIEKNDLNEKHYFNAYHKLFFIYPPMEGDGKGQIKLSNGATADYPVLQTAYKHMTTKYRQDVIVDTYLTGRLTEDYLAVVDKTLQRLDMCLHQDWGKAGLNEQKCTFFGLHMVEVKNNNQAPSDPEGDNSGQLGAAMNAYVVTTVYDRLLRIVEDLTATEAVYRAAKQLDMADPIMPEQQSSAEKYLPKTYQFAHNEIYEHSHAKSLLNSYERTKACENGGTGCPDKNKDKTEAANIDNTDVLGKLQPIDEMLSKAVQLHNLKNQMPEYKAQFRKYKKAKEIHARALKTVEQSDQCVQDFLKRHGGKNIVWGTSKPANDYESRSGISYELIRAYEQAIKDTIIGTTAECEGYYSTQNSCPEGYVLDTKEYCRYVDKDGKMVSKPSLHPCVVETVAYDTEGSENNSDIPNDYEEAGGNLLQKISSGNDSYDNADYLIESGNADKIELDNRKKSEQAWRIGYNKMMELTENGSLKFAPWNDQQNLQEEYLHNKYRNMRIIIKSVDQGAKSYQIAAALANNTTYTGKEPIRDLIRDVTECASLDEARNAAYQEYCAGYPKTTNVFVTKNGVTQNKTVQLTCGVTKNDNNGVLTGKRMEKVNGEIVEQTKEWKQIVSANRNCPFKGTRKTSLPETENNAYKCAGSWDFTVKTLVKKYFPAVLGGCSANPEERVYNEAQNHGRKIAKDYFNDVLQARRNGEQTILNVVKTYNDGLNQDKKALQSAKDSIKIYNQQINEATEEKNRLIKEVKRTKQRTADIKNEKTDIEQRLKSDVIVEKDKCTLKIKLALLDNESRCINNQNASINTNACPSECSDKKEMREKQCQQLKTFNCKTYVRDTSYIENSKPGTSELTFVIPSLAEKKIAELNAKISKAKAAQREIKDNVKSLEDKIKEKAENFAQLYLAISSAEQAAIDLANKNFEDFLESADGTSSPNRMKDVKHRKCCGPLGLCTKRCDRNYATDNLQTTLEQTTYHGENLETAIKYGSSENRESLNSVWFKNMNISSLASNLQSIGVPASFVTDGSVLGLAAGPQSAVIMADAIINKGAKEEVLDLAAKTIASHIKQADKIIKEEVDKAVNDVNKMAQSLGVLNTNTISREQASYILKPENYADIVNRHNVLIKNITQPLPANTLILQKAGMELSEIFGIPDTIKTDEEYFVGLPARGDNYNGRDIEKDKDAGRDYYAPKGPLLNLPPVREVFYYSALDYDDTPKNDGHPAISYLLNFKYPDGE
ncbi:MAG: hypothetical protein J6C85_04290, partial [Alphaproteobacteria bacterium]|nr:hypothetical protein [Alphaproteobacteria bacterium]